LIQYFYEGLFPIDRNMVDAASGGALVNKTPADARNLFNLMAQNTQQFGARNSQVKMENEIGSSSALENQLSHITAKLNKIVTRGIQKIVICDICCLEGHSTDACPTLQEGNVNALYSNQNQRRSDPYSNTYNEGWRDHPNLRYGPKPNPLGFDQPSRQPSSQDRTNFLLEQVLKKMDDRFQSMETTLKQVPKRQTAIDTIVSNLQAQIQNRLPSQSYHNPKENVSAITFKSGKELKEPTKNREVEPELEVEGAEPELDTKSNQTTKELGERKREPYKPIPAFPSRYRSPASKVSEANQEILETFRKVEINIPLLDAIKQVPRHAKFLKELYTTKRKLIGNEKISVGQKCVCCFLKKTSP